MSLAGIFTFGSPCLLPGPRFHHRALGMALPVEGLSFCECTWNGDKAQLLSVPLGPGGLGSLQLCLHLLPPSQMLSKTALVGVISGSRDNAGRRVEGVPELRWWTWPFNRVLVKLSVTSLYSWLFWSLVYYSVPYLGLGRWPFI